MKPIRGLLWTKELRPLKTDSIDNKTGVVLMHQPMNLLHRELCYLLDACQFQICYLAFKASDITIGT
jgi:hypothetical protein